MTRQRLASEAYKTNKGIIEQGTHHQHVHNSARSSFMYAIQPHRISSVYRDCLHVRQLAPEATRRQLPSLSSSLCNISSWLPVRKHRVLNVNRIWKNAFLRLSRTEMNKIRICIVTVPFRLSRITEINPKLLRHPDRIRVFVIVYARSVQADRSRADWNAQMNASRTRHRPITDRNDSIHAACHLTPFYLKRAVECVHFR